MIENLNGSNNEEEDADVKDLSILDEMK